MDGVPSLEEELQRELAKQSSDARQVEERLKASQALLFDLDRKPAAASKAAASTSKSAASASPPASRPSPASASSGGGERKPPSISPPAGARRQDEQAGASPPSAMAKPPTYSGGAGRASPAIRGGAGESSSRPSPATTAADASPAPGGGAFGNEDVLAISAEVPLADMVVEEGTGVQLPGFCGCAAMGSLGSLDQQLFAFTGIAPPAEATFQPYFREWFEQEHFPKFSKKLQKELVSRASSKGFFSGLSSQVKKWAMANTDTRLQSEAWCAYFLEYAPPSFRVFGCVRVASVNLGSQALPCWVTFWGLPDSQGDRWVAPPWSSGAGADVGGILDELDERGGMAALAAAAAQ